MIINHRFEYFFSKTFKIENKGKKTKPTEEEINETKKQWFKDYFTKMNLQHIQDESLAIQMFDFAVHMGVDIAVKTLQNIMRITVDGKCGQQTITCANVRHHKSVREDYRKARIGYYNSISKDVQKKTLNSWIKRCGDIDLNLAV